MHFDCLKMSSPYFHYRHFIRFIRTCKCIIIFSRQWNANMHCLQFSFVQIIHNSFCNFFFFLRLRKLMFRIKIRIKFLLFFRIKKNVLWLFCKLKHNSTLGIFLRPLMLTYTLHVCNICYPFKNVCKFIPSIFSMTHILVE